jgi:hypothetical protein
MSQHISDPMPAGILTSVAAAGMIGGMLYDCIRYKSQKKSFNQTRQPKPEARLGCISASLARRGCARRWI